MTALFKRGAMLLGLLLLSNCASNSISPKVDLLYLDGFAEDRIEPSLVMSFDNLELDEQSRRISDFLQQLQEEFEALQEVDQSLADAVPVFSLKVSDGTLFLMDAHIKYTAVKANQVSGRAIQSDCQQYSDVEYLGTEMCPTILCVAKQLAFASKDSGCISADYFLTEGGDWQICYYSCN